MLLLLLWFAVVAAIVAAVLVAVVATVTERIDHPRACRCDCGIDLCIEYSLSVCCRFAADLLLVSTCS